MPTLVCKDCSVQFNSDKLFSKYCEVCTKEHKPAKHNSDKYQFSDYIVTDDKNWKTERRIQWKKESDESRARIIAKYGTRPFVKSQDSF